MEYLVFGVVDVPYENEGVRPKNKPKRGKGSKTSTPTTTFQVATILEEKYGVMQTFFDSNKEKVVGHMIESAEGALENLFHGGMAVDPFGLAGQEIQADFKMFLQTAEIEGLGIPGVPTKAAQQRKSLRFKSRTGPSIRPSFIDTGTYELSFRAWIE